MFGDPDALIQLDMSEYMEKFSASRLIGSPPGYVGYEEGGSSVKLCAAVPTVLCSSTRSRKRTRDVMHLLLQILEEGTLTDSFGRKVDFRNTIIILTSNVGAELIKKQSVIGFGAINADSHDYDSMKEKITEQAKRQFKPEFLNRMDDLIVFHMLEKVDLIRIVDLEIDKVLKRVKDKAHQRAP